MPSTYNNTITLVTITYKTMQTHFNTRCWAGRTPHSVCIPYLQHALLAHVTLSEVKHRPLGSKTGWVTALPYLTSHHPTLSCLTLSRPHTVTSSHFKLKKTKII